LRQSNFGRAAATYVDTFVAPDFVHRPFSAVHLRTTRDSLFPMAGAVSDIVIYIIMDAKMKTLHHISITQNKSSFRLRSILILTGIAIAVICSLVSVNGIHAAESATAVPQSVKTPFVKFDVLTNAASMITHPAILLIDKH
jgi:hypothetical protein